jgi:hypothetical protein
MSSLMLTRVPEPVDLLTMPTVAPAGQTTMSPDGGEGSRQPYRRFRWKRDGAQGEGEDPLTEPRLPLQPGEALRLGAQVDVLA